MHTPKSNKYDAQGEADEQGSGRIKLGQTILQLLTQLMKERHIAYALSQSSQLPHTDIDIAMSERSQVIKSN